MTTPRAKCKCKNCMTWEDAIKYNRLRDSNPAEYISCPSCPMLFEIKDQLIAHQVMHSMKHPYKCTLCHVHAYVYRKDLVWHFTKYHGLQKDEDGTYTNSKGL